jgi:hypothetical protein
MLAPVTTYPIFSWNNFFNLLDVFFKSLYDGDEGVVPARYLGPICFMGILFNPVYIC